MNEAVQRIETLLNSGNFDNVADILADIMHYCNSKEMNLQDELYTAEQYVTEDDSFNYE